MDPERMTERKFNRGKRGRPSIAELNFKKYDYYNFVQRYGNAEPGTIRGGGKKDSTKRTEANWIYCRIGQDLIESVAEDLPYLKTLLPDRMPLKSPMPEFQYYASRSGILEQLGRALQQDQADPLAVIQLARWAEQWKHEGYKSKQISQMLRDTRKRLKTATDSEIKEFIQNATIPPDRRDN